MKDKYLLKVMAKDYVFFAFICTVSLFYISNGVAVCAVWFAALGRLGLTVNTVVLKYYGDIQ